MTCLDAQWEQILSNDPVGFESCQSRSRDGLTFKERTLIQLPINPCARYGGLIRCKGGLVKRLESLKSKF